MSHKIVYIEDKRGGLPHVVLAPPMYELRMAREIVEIEIRALPEDHEVEDLVIALGRRGFVWPMFTRAEVAL